MQSHLSLRWSHIVYKVPLSHVLARIHCGIGTPFLKWHMECKNSGSFWCIKFSCGRSSKSGSDTDRPNPPVRNNMFFPICSLYCVD